MDDLYKIFYDSVENFSLEQCNSIYIDILKIINDNDALFIILFSKTEEFIMVGDDYGKYFFYKMSNYKELYELSKTKIKTKQEIIQILSNIHKQIEIINKIFRNKVKDGSVGAMDYLHIFDEKMNDILMGILNKTSMFYYHNEWLLLQTQDGGKLLKKTKETVNVVYKKKSYKRTVFLNKNKKKFVKINNKLLDLSKLKKI